MPRPKGLPKTGGGTRKGVPNRATAELKDMILGALEKAGDGGGGEAYLLERAKDPRTSAAFLSLVGKVLPTTLAGDGKNPLQVIVQRLTESAK